MSRFGFAGKKVKGSLSLLVIFLCIWPQSLIAAGSTVSDAELKQLRKWFSRAETIAHRPKSGEYKFLSQKLQGYPLKPYVQLKTLMRYPYLSNKPKIDRFLTKYEGSPLDAPLRKKWLRYLANHDQQALFLHYYRDLSDSGLYCQQLKYKLQRDELKNEALNEVDDLWLVGKSQPKACDGVFKIWEEAGRRTNEIIYERLKLAADGGKHTLIPYLKKLLAPEDRYLADLWLQVRRSPSYISRTSRFPAKMPEKEAEILTYGLKRLIWKDRDLALKTWDKLRKQFPFSAGQRQQIAERFAIGLVTINHKKAELWLERANRLSEDEEIFRWHLAHVLRQDNWQHAIDVIEAAPESISNDLSYQYWEARSYEKLKSTKQAQTSFQELAKNRHYYGFLASGKLNQTPSMVNTPLTFTEQEMQSVAHLPAAQRAYEFYQMKRYTSARREWRYLLSQLTLKSMRIAAVLADSWGWHHQAIRTFTVAGYMDDIERRFPLAFREQLQNNAQQYNIEAAWAFAITRRESSFMVDANSGAGAKGLMQLLPGTVRYLEKTRVKNRRLFEPEFNVQMGTKYLRYLMDRMDENPVLATASYNAGWRRVQDWLPENKAMPLDVWVETIPFKETRNYVKAVMAYKQIYMELLGKDTNLFQDLSKMQIRPDNNKF